MYAEDPARGFRPSSGLLTEVKLPGGVRVDSWIEPGTDVTAFYDPMLAKIIARGATRELAIANLARALQASRIDGIETNLPYLVSVLKHPVFAAGEQTPTRPPRHSSPRFRTPCPCAAAPPTDISVGRLSDIPLPAPR